MINSFGVGRPCFLQRSYCRLLILPVCNSGWCAKRTNWPIPQLDEQCYGEHEPLGVTTAAQDCSLSLLIRTGQEPGAAGEDGHDAVHPLHALRPLRRGGGRRALP